MMPRLAARLYMAALSVSSPSGAVGAWWKMFEQWNGGMNAPGQSGVPSPRDRPWRKP